MRFVFATWDGGSTRLIIVQTIVATDARPNNYSAHSRGVCAILRTDNSPFDMLNNVRVWQVANPLFLKEPPSVRNSLYLDFGNL